jgi:hypothetical protein
MENLVKHQDGFRYRTGAEGPIVEFEVSYELGGTNFLSGNSSARGIYAYIRPMTISEGICSFALFGSAQQSGMKFKLLELPRKNAKKVTECAEIVDNVAPAAAGMWRTDMQQAIKLMQSAQEAVRVHFTPVKFTPRTAITQVSAR